MTQHRYRSAPRRCQRGVTLVVGMIMLVLITLLVLASFHLGRNNLEIVGNAQQRNEALAAAQQTIEAAVDSPLLTSNPAAIFPTPCAGWTGNTLCYDVNADGTNDVVVQITPPPTCVKGQAIPLTSLSLTDPNDQACRTQVQQCFGQEGAREHQLELRQQPLGHPRRRTKSRSGWHLRRQPGRRRRRESGHRQARQGD
jgi:Tfp pilus assembly protein PilV